MITGHIHIKIGQIHTVHKFTANVNRFANNMDQLKALFSVVFLVYCKYALSEIQTLNFHVPCEADTLSTLTPHAEYPARSRTQCVALCGTDAACRSVDYQSTQHACRLFSALDITCTNQLQTTGAIYLQEVK